MPVFHACRRSGWRPLRPSDFRGSRGDPGGTWIPPRRPGSGDRPIVWILAGGLIGAATAGAATLATGSPVWVALGAYAAGGILATLVLAVLHVTVDLAGRFVRPLAGAQAG